MKHELVELVVHLHWDCMVVSLNLGRSKLNFPFAKFLFDMNLKGLHWKLECTRAWKISRLKQGNLVRGARIQ